LTETVWATVAICFPLFSCQSTFASTQYEC